MLRCFAVVLAPVWAVRVCAGPDDDRESPKHPSPRTRGIARGE